jgi:hypothetical protein
MRRALELLSQGLESNHGLTGACVQIAKDPRHFDTEAFEHMIIKCFVSSLTQTVKGIFVVADANSRNSFVDEMKSSLLACYTQLEEVEFATEWEALE